MNTKLRRLEIKKKIRGKISEIENRKYRESEKINKINKAAVRLISQKKKKKRKDTNY